MRRLEGDATSRSTSFFLIGGAVGFGYLAVIILANLGCSGYFTRADVLFMLFAGLASAGALLRLGAKRVPPSPIVQLPFGVLAGLAITPSLPIVLSVLFTGLGLATPLYARERAVGVVILVVAAVATYVVLYALVGLVTPAQARCA